MYKLREIGRSVDGSLRCCRVTVASICIYLSVPFLLKIDFFFCYPIQMTAEPQASWMNFRSACPNSLAIILSDPWQRYLMLVTSTMDPA